MKKLKIGIAVLLSATMLTGCGVTDFVQGFKDGYADAAKEQSPDTGGKAEKSEKKLDTGKYKTEPSVLKKDTDAEVVRTVESYVLAEYMPLPYEVDGILTSTKGGYNIYGPGSMSLHMTNNQIKILEQFPLLYGYLQAASSPTEKVNDPHFSVNHAVLRFEDPDSALRFAEAENVESLTVGPIFLENEPPNPGEKVEIEGLPNTLVTSNYAEYNDSVSFSAFTPLEEYVIYTWVSTPAAEAAWGPDYIKKALEKQVPMLEQFPSVKTGAGFGKTDQYPSIDPGGVVIYTVEAGEDDQKRVPGSYGPRGIASQFTNPKAIHDTLVQTGSKHIGRRESFVFRADNDFGAKSILNAFVSDNLQSGEVEYEEPQGVPDTTCTMSESTNGVQYNCYVVKGRYVGYVSGSSDTTKENIEEKKKLVSQKIAAQYMILQKADQEAGKDK
ncbi:DUF7373 family lipoprotein [Corynebacterium freiburgense]|uniref:DUF7373 family lipoprotein n=1 Tax=Corynebacterium freiburgense TaxID=556548 RepID=UPI0003FCA6B0|nr:hypothetical protein [Corynebacterium freiburgense]WJZ01432.1 hypothetical protein CFREI_00610 [Corynebacterium freiburgense]